MNLARPTDPSVRVALTGAAGAFGRTALLALRSHKSQRPTVLCDLDLPALRRMLTELGYSEDLLVDCSTEVDVRRTVDAGGIALVDKIDLLVADAYDLLVEATGVVRVSARAALAAIDAGRPVVLASKETESLFGRALAERARTRGVVCTTGAGDQPANLVALLHWADRLGFEVVAAGKSSEYDLVFDPATGNASVLDVSTPAPRLGELWNLGDDIASTLRERKTAVAQLKLGAAADYCEIAVVANLTGMRADVSEMHYPIARYRELADVYRRREEGGILTTTGSLDVFVLLREPGEASFAGGEFIVVRCDDPDTADLLERKGHVVSRSGDHLCIGLPFHLMGLEIPGTIADAVDGRPVATPAADRTTMIARAVGDLAVGTPLDVTGHHHEIAGTTPALVPGTEAGADLVPYYLLGGTRLSRAVVAGQPLRFDDVEGFDQLLLDLAALDRTPDHVLITEGVS